MKKHGELMENYKGYNLHFRRIRDPETRTFFGRISAIKEGKEIYALEGENFEYNNLEKRIKNKIDRETP